MARSTVSCSRSTGNLARSQGPPGDVTRTMRSLRLIRSDPPAAAHPAAPAPPPLPHGHPGPHDHPGPRSGSPGTPDRPHGRPLRAEPPRAEPPVAETPRGGRPRNDSSRAEPRPADHRPARQGALRDAPPPRGGGSARSAGGFPVPAAAGDAVAGEPVAPRHGPRVQPAPVAPPVQRVSAAVADLRTAPDAPASPPGPRPAGPQAGPTDPEPVDRSAPDLPDEVADGPWALVRRAQAGDMGAFSELFDRYYDVVFRYVLFRMNDRTLAEDITQETFLRALRRISSVSYQGRDIGAWFVTIARNLIFDHVKSSRYRLESTTSDIIELSPSTHGPEQQVLDLTTNEELLRCVRKLNADQQECISLRFLQGLSVAETAKIMDRNEGAVKALQHRAVRRLAQLLPEGLR